jgi:hypothetical protein
MGNSCDNRFLETHLCMTQQSTKHRLCMWQRPRHQIPEYSCLQVQFRKVASKIISTSSNFSSSASWGFAVSYVTPLYMLDGHIHMHTLTCSVGLG